MPQSALAASAPADDRGETPHLSTDYLNRFGEALMLIELTAADPDVLQDLKAWRPMGYAEHFADSPLRCAGSATAAYAALDPDGRAAFDALCSAMGRLILTMTALLEERSGDAALTSIIDVGVDSLKAHMSRANQFINANGAVAIESLGNADIQATIDRAFA